MMFFHGNDCDCGNCDLSLRRKLTDKIGGNNDYDKADASNVKINVIKEIIKGLGL